MTTAEQVLARTIRVGDCMIWQGAVQSSGYGSVFAGNGRRTLLAHRLVFTEMVGPIEDGLTVDHLCRQKLCQNVFHMELVTASENSRRRFIAQTHCKHNHPLSGENVRIQSRADGHNRRVCLTCQRRNNESYRAAHAA